MTDEYTAKEKLEVMFKEITSKDIKTLKPKQVAEILNKHQPLKNMFREVVKEAIEGTDLTTGLGVLFPEGTGRD